MVSKTFKILFILRKRKNGSRGPLPIYMRLTVHGTRVELTTSRQCDPATWNKVIGRAIGTKEETRSLNSYLDLFQSKVYDAQRELLSKGDDVTTLAIRDRMLGREEGSKTLMEVYRYQVKQVEELVGKEYAVGTLKRFKSAQAALEEFIKQKYKVNDMPIHSLTFQFITEFEFFLKSVRCVQHNTAMGNLKELKKIVRQCVANGWLEKDPFMSYKVKIRDTNRTYLTEGELNKIAEKKLSIERLNLVRNIFLFSCYTGLSYCDVAKLTPSDIATGIDGCKWIFIARTKTGTPSRIPLLPPALVILDKYSNDPWAVNAEKCLPIFSNQRMNSYLKEIADSCDIHKELTFHCARHTFATTVTLTNGVPMETVSKMLGHKNIRTTQQYARIVDRKVSEDMNCLLKKFQTRKKGQLGGHSTEQEFISDVTCTKKS
jgi:integrase